MSEEAKPENPEPDPGGEEEAPPVLKAEVEVGQKQMREEEPESTSGLDKIADGAEQTGGGGSKVNGGEQHGKDRMSADLEDSSSSSSQEPSSEKTQRNGFNSASVCDLCNTNYSSCTLLVKHMQDRHPNKPIRECSQCHKMFSSLKALEGHQCQSDSSQVSSEEDEGLMMEEEDFEEPANSPAIPGEDSMPPSPTAVAPSAAAPANRGLPYACSFCDRKFPLPFLLRKHMMIHDQPFQCAVCQQRFMKIEGLNLHKRLIHDVAGMSTFKCLFCGKKDFLLLSDMYTHRVETHGHIPFQGEREKPFGCGVCQKPYQRRGDALVCALLGHQEKTLQEAMFQHKCAQCSETSLGYHSLQALKQHWDKEHQDKAFPHEAQALQDDKENGGGLLPCVIIDKFAAYELREKGPPPLGEGEPPLILEFDLISIPEETEGTKRPSDNCVIPVFCCPDCPLSFVDVDSLRIHENVHLQDEGPPQDTPEKKRGRPASQARMAAELMAPICLVAPSGNQGGYRAKHLVPKFDCKVCGQKFRKLKRLRDHEQVHRKPDALPRLPGKPGRKPNLMKKKKPLLSRRGRPRKLVSARASWRESEDSEDPSSSSSSYSTADDATYEHLPEARPYQCSICGLTFLTDKSLRIHELQIHKAPHRKPGRKPGVKYGPPAAPKQPASASVSSAEGPAVPAQRQEVPLAPGRIRVGRLEISTKFNKLIKQNAPIKICVTGEDGQSTFHFQCPVCPKVFKDKRGIHLHILGHGIKHENRGQGQGQPEVRRRRSEEEQQQEEAQGAVPSALSGQRRTSERERRIPRKLSEYEVDEEEGEEPAPGPKPGPGPATTFKEIGTEIVRKWPGRPRATPPQPDYYGGEQEEEEEEEEAEDSLVSEEEEEEQEKPQLPVPPPEPPTCKICLKTFESVTELWYHGNQEHFKSTKVKYVPKPEVVQKTEVAEKKVEPAPAKIEPVRDVQAPRKVYEGFGRKNPAVLALLQKKREQQKQQLQQMQQQQQNQEMATEPKPETPGTSAAIFGVNGGTLGVEPKGDKMESVPVSEGFRQVLPQQKPLVMRKANEHGEQVVKAVVKKKALGTIKKAAAGIPKIPKKRGRPPKDSPNFKPKAKAPLPSTSRTSYTHNAASGVAKTSENNSPAVEQAPGESKMAVAKPSLSPTSNEFRFKIIKKSVIMHCEENEGEPQPKSEVVEGEKKEVAVVASTSVAPPTVTMEPPVESQEAEGQSQESIPSVETEVVAEAATPMPKVDEVVQPVKPDCVENGVEDNADSDVMLPAPVVKPEAIPLQTKEEVELQQAKKLKLAAILQNVDAKRVASAVPALVPITPSVLPQTEVAKPEPELNSPDVIAAEQKEPEVVTPSDAIIEPESAEQAPAVVVPVNSAAAASFLSSPEGESPEEPVKRKRGRPRKYPQAALPVLTSYETSPVAPAIVQEPLGVARRLSSEISIMINGDRARTVEGVRLDGFPAQQKLEPLALEPPTKPELMEPAVYSGDEAETPPPPVLMMMKRKGRPPKNRSSATSSISPASKENPGTSPEISPPTGDAIKRKKGRPRKSVVVQQPAPPFPETFSPALDVIPPTSTSPLESPPVKRARGRPRKYPLSLPTSPELHQQQQQQQLPEENKVTPTPTSPLAPTPAPPQIPVPLSLASPDIVNFVETGDPVKRKRGRPRKSMPVLTANLPKN